MGVVQGRLDDPAEFHPVHPWHHDVADHELNGMGFEDLEGVAAAGGLQNGIAGAKDAFEEVQYLLFIVDQ